MKAISFSICIPNYNYGHYIGKTIQSVLDQSYQNFEIIVADNASSDHSLEVVEAFKDQRIRVIRNHYNIGFAPNLQRATMYARNDFINLLSSDDLMNPTALETYAAILSERAEMGRDMVLIADAELINARGEVIGHIRKSKHAHEMVSLVGAEDEVFSGLEILKESLSNLRNFAPFLTVVYPRQLWQAVEGYNAVRSIGPDKFFNYKLLAQDPEVIYVHSALYQYRVHVSPNQQAQKINLKQQLDDYLYTLEYSDQFLAALGLLREDLINAFLKRVCLKKGLTELVYGSYSQAFRMLMFALATYPAETVRMSRFYMLLGLLACGPFSRGLARFFYRGYHERELRNVLGEGSLS